LFYNWDERFGIHFNKGGIFLEKMIMNHMELVRGVTEASMNKIPEEIWDIIPYGFSNNIRWNFGHIAYVQEKIVFALLGESMGIPKEYEEFFSPGTKPAEWVKTPPSFEEISQILSEQKGRIKEFLQGRLEEKLPTPYTNKGGVTFNTVGEIFLFSFYHEASHMETIKRLQRAISLK
jgi:hypothetical protein